MCYDILDYLGRVVSDTMSKRAVLIDINRGAILLEALLVMGILMLSMPIIVQQIQRRNETVENLVISEEIKAVQNAASGFVVFEKEHLFQTYFPDEACGIEELPYTTMITNLQKYGFPSSFYSNPKLNPLGLRHSLVLYCERESSSSRTLKGYVISRVSSTAGLTSIKANEILNLLGWNAAFIDRDDDVGPVVVSNLPEYKLPDAVKNRIGYNAFVISHKQQKNFGDYMAKTLVNKDPQYNTMMTTLDMNNNNIYCVSDISGYEMKILDPNGWKIKYLKTNNLKSNSLLGENLKYHSYNRSYSDSIQMKSTALYATDIVADSIRSYSFDTHGLTNVTSFMHTTDLEVNGPADIKEINFAKSVDIDVLRLANPNAPDTLLPVTANGYNVTNAIIVTGSDKITDNIENPKARISVGDKSTVVSDIRIVDKNGNETWLSDEIYKHVVAIKQAWNEVITTWP